MGIPKNQDALRTAIKKLYRKLAYLENEKNKLCEKDRVDELETALQKKVAKIIKLIMDSNAVYESTIDLSLTNNEINLIKQAIKWSKKYNENKEGIEAINLKMQTLQRICQNNHPLKSLKNYYFHCEDCGFEKQSHS